MSRRKNKCPKLPDLQIKRVEPDELPQDIVFRLNFGYRTSLQDFVIMVDNPQGIIYIRKNVVTDAEIEKIIEIITYPGNDVLNDATDRGKFADHVFSKYGWGADHIMIDANNYRREIVWKQRAQKHAKKILPFIKKYFDERDTPCYEQLIDVIASESRRALFDFGYLVGKGLIYVSPKGTLRIKDREGGTVNG